MMRASKSGGRLTIADGTVWVAKNTVVQGTVAFTGTGTSGPVGGDFDGNGTVDGTDFFIWQRGGSPNSLSAADLAEWQANFGRPGSPLSTLVLDSGTIGLDGGTLVLTSTQAGGFASRQGGAGTTVTINGGADLDWDSETGGFNGQALQLGSNTADAPLILTNNLNLGSAAEQLIQVASNPGSTADVAPVAAAWVTLNCVTGPGSSTLTFWDAGAMVGKFTQRPAIRPLVKQMATGLTAPTSTTYGTGIPGSLNKGDGMRKQHPSLAGQFARHTISAAAMAVLLLASAAMAQGPNGLRSDMDQETLSIFAGHRPVLGYRLVPNPFKPYVEKFFTPDGINVIRDSPSDHKHHHGLMFAIAVDGLNFWEEHNAPGKQLTRATSPVQVTTRAGIERASFTQQLDWINPRNEQLYVREERTITVYRAADLPVSLLSWETRLSVPEGKPSATLGGHRYFGLGGRFLASMDDGGHFQNADGKTGVEETNLVPSAWCAYSAKADGKPVTLAMFDAPNNPRHPAKWYTMGDKPKEFAYLAATLNLKQEPLTISAGHPLRVRYCVALWDGQIDGKQIDGLYRRWISW